MIVKAYKINAFAKTIKGGNPAGVVLNGDTLSENQMKRIASTLGLSETAFVMKSDCADFKVRFFTPIEEVNLCGHATIGTFSILLNVGLIKSGSYTQETKAGVLKVEVNEDSLIMMDQRNPDFYEIIDREEIADSLNITVKEMDDKLFPQIISTGLRDIMVPIRSIKTLNSINPNLSRVAEVSRKYNSTGYHIFTLDSLYNSNAHCRNMAPLYGIPEEPATGTSSGALACYLFENNIIKAENAGHIVFEQGYTMNMPSEIIVSLIIEGSQVIKVKVGGRALNLSEVELEI